MKKLLKAPVGVQLSVLFLVLLVVVLFAANPILFTISAAFFSFIVIGLVVLAISAVVSYYADNS